MKNTPRVLIALIMMADNIAAAGGGRRGLSARLLYRGLFNNGAVPVINAQQPRGPNAEICEL